MQVLDDRLCGGRLADQHTVLGDPVDAARRLYRDIDVLEARFGNVGGAVEIPDRLEDVVVRGPKDEPPSERAGNYFA